MEYWNRELLYNRYEALGEQASCLFAQCTGRMPVLPVSARQPPRIRLRRTRNLALQKHHSNIPTFH